MEGNAYETCLAASFDLLEEHMDYYWRSWYGHLDGPIGMMKMELKFLQMVLRGLGYCGELDNDWHLRFAINTLGAKLRQIDEEFVADCKSGDEPGQVLDLEAVMYDLSKKIEEHLIRLKAKNICTLLLVSVFKCTSCPCNQKEFCKYVQDTTSFRDLILGNLKALLKSNLVAPVMKQQIALVQRGLEDFSMFVGPPDGLFDLIPRTRAWFNRISCLTYLYWIDGSDERLASAMENMLSAVLLQKTTPCTTSGVISPFFQHATIHQLLAGYVDFLLEDLIIPMKDGTEILHEGLIILLSFLMDPPQDDSEDGEIIWSRIHAVINKFPSLIYSIPSDELDEEFLKNNFSKFLLDIHTIKEKVRKLFAVPPYSSRLRSPNTNALGFLDVLIGNMKKLLQGEVNLIPSFLHLCELLLTELVALRPLLKSIMELLENGEYGEIQYLWRESIDMVYNADYITKLCHPKTISSWYGIIALPDAIKLISDVKIEINKQVGVDNVHNKKKTGYYDWMEGAEALLPRSTTSEMDKDYMGFIKDETDIINVLTNDRGRKPLTIISISGSGGQGKTTLAKGIYNKVQRFFQKCVWCYVSKDCPVKELLAEILSNDRDAELGMQDLIERVRKSLKGRRYLIVLDDIWDVDTWGELRSSFPDDNKGSRILLTSRNHDLNSQVESNWISHPLPLFSDEESWELMKKKVFGPNDCDKEFVEIGKVIASFCKGLPLAVVLIAAVLGKTGRKLDLWNRVAENIKEHLDREGCGKMIELSYKYLPEYLKPCFLYFGAFKRGENVSAKKLKLLWIGEGFIIQGRETDLSEEDLATECLNKLASQALVTVTERGSMGKIKRCSVHDLLYDLCLEKCKEDNFLNWLEEDNIDVDRTCPIHHRLRVGVSDPFIRSSSIVNNRELPTSSVHSFLASAKFIESRRSHLQFLGCFKILTVLNLDLWLRMEEFPEEVLSNIHLTYLGVSFSDNIEALPPTIANLWKLRTIIISAFSLTLVPVCVWSMKSLRHVAISGARLDLEGVDHKNSGNLIGIGSNIQTLGRVSLDEIDDTTEELLRHFPSLRNLRCNLTSGTRNLLKLFYLVGSLLTQLESLRIHGMCMFEEYTNTWNFPKIKNLKKLTLVGTKMPWSVLSEIGKQLPNLNALKLLWEACAGLCWKLEGGDFSNLKYLQLRKMDFLEEIDASSCDDNLPFPCLEHLILEGCSKLKEIPSVFEEINTLKTMKVRYCPMDVEISARRIWENQREFGNDDIQIVVVSKKILFSGV